MISGQDYPIRPLPEIERELRDSPYDGYVAGTLVDPPSWRTRDSDDFTRRYFYRYRPIPEPGRLGRRAIAAARPLLALGDTPDGALLGRRCRVPFSATLRCRRGPDWLTLRRRAVEIVVGAPRELVHHYVRTMCPTESLPQTVLHAAPELKLDGGTRRFTQWADGAWHPDVLGRADLERILASGADFARKFDSTLDSAVLDELDRVVGSA
jgi:hypothetical protein